MIMPNETGRSRGHLRVIGDHQLALKLVYGGEWYRARRLVLAKRERVDRERANSH